MSPAPVDLRIDAGHRTARARDWHQFRLLSKDAVRQLIDSALLSRDSDPMQFVMWMIALIATPTAFFAFRNLNTYTELLVVEAPEAVVQQIALGHRLFFITYGMLASALLASLTWEAVFPDGRDQEIIGVLPVRPHVFAAARLWAALTVGFVFAAAVNVPAALMYSVFALGHPVFNYNFAGLFGGHLLATMLSSMLVFCSLLTVRGLAAIIFGAQAGRWLGLALQLIAVVLMFEVFFFLPGVLNAVVTRLMAGDQLVLSLPPAWFAALHAWLVGSANQLLEQAMLRGLVAVGLIAVVLPPIYLLPAGWLGRRALEKRSRQRATLMTYVVRMVSSITNSTAAVRGIFLFAVASLLRSRQHLLVLSSYFGMAVAVSIASAVIIAERRGGALFDVSVEWMLALPMLFGFFGIVGLRAAFRIPTELEGNWPFRLAPPPLTTCVNASLLTMFTVVVLPVAVLTAAILVVRLPIDDVAMIAGLQILAGITLIECLLLRWTKVPFACAHLPSPDVLKAWWPLWAFSMYFYAFQLSRWQVAALESSRALMLYVAVGLSVIGLVRLSRRREFRHKQLEFDLVQFNTIELNLSEATK